MVSPTYLASPGNTGCVWIIGAAAVIFLAALMFIDRVTRSFAEAPAFTMFAWGTFIGVLVMLVALRWHAAYLRHQHVDKHIRFAVIENLPELMLIRARELEADSYGHVESTGWERAMDRFLEETVTPRLTKKENKILTKRMKSKAKLIEDHLADVDSGKLAEAFS